MDKKIPKPLFLISLAIFVVILLFLSQLQPTSKVTDLKADASSCYFSEGDILVDLNISWENMRRDDYHLYYGGEVRDLEVNKIGKNRYQSEVTLRPDECPREKQTMKTALLKTLSDDEYYEVPFSISLFSEKRYNFKLYGCEYPYYDTFEREKCFVDLNSIDPLNEINIHGSHTNKASQNWKSLFVVFENCSTCRIPKYIKFETATLSHTRCEMYATVDINNAGIYNYNIFPGGDTNQYHNLKTRDSVEIPNKKTHG